jgi:hypothetical protein
VHFERLNLSIFTGRLNEEDMRTFHRLEYERLTGEASDETESSFSQNPRKGESE